MSTPIAVGARFGRLTVAAPRQAGQEQVSCVCDCGTTRSVRFDALLGGNTKSCGCLRRGATSPNWRGGKRSHPLYWVWNSMIGRCHRPGDTNYPKYGARGIQVCDRWRNDFWTFVADMGERPAGKSPSGRALYSLDRIDSDGHYEPGNVRWATDSQQALNKRQASS